MGRCITHLLDSQQPIAGHPCCVLPGLFAFQRSRGWEVEIIAPESLDRGLSAVARADIVHVHGVSDWTCTIAWSLLKRRPGSYVVSTYAMTMPRPFRRRGWPRPWGPSAARRKLLRRAWCLHALSEMESGHLKSTVNRRVKVLPLGVDPLPRTSHHPADGLRTLLFLGPLHPSEGIVPFLKAAALLADTFDDCRLVLAGTEDKHWTPAIQAGIRRQGFADRVTVIGDADAATIERLLQQATLVVAPSAGETCPVGPLMALARGKPVLISPGCNLPDVPLRKAGWVVPAKRVELHRALQKAFECSAAELDLMGHCGRELTQERYAWERLGHEYLNLYEKVLQ